MGAVYCVYWGHPVVETKGKVLIKEIGTLVRAIDEIEREGRRSVWSGPLFDVL